jgi:hypothetical protein
MKEQKKARFQCDKCPYAATKAHDLKRHVKARHLKVSVLLCNLKLSLNLIYEINVALY